MQKIIRITQVISIVLTLSFVLDHLFAGETGKIAGKVVDAQTGNPLVGANVIISANWIDDKEIALDIPLGVATDEEGEYFILNVSPGFYTVWAGFIGYTKELRTKVEVVVDKTSRVDFELFSETIKGEEVVVTAYKRDKVEHDLTATRQTYGASQIDGIPGIKDVGDILNLQADVYDGHFRGGRSGEELYLVGGASIMNPLTNSRTFSPITTAIQEVEVYTSGFSAEYGNVQSGVINIIAKEGRSDKWETKVDAYMTNSSYKTWGGSIYSKDYLDYFNMLNSAEVWADSTDPVSGVLLWTHFGLRFPNYYIPETKLIQPFPPVYSYPDREDSLRAAQLVKILWLQSVRDVGLEYAKPDYRIELSTGGPISKHATIYIAVDQNTSHPILPAERPDVERQVMSNITIKPNISNKIKLIYNYSDSYENDITDTFYRWFEKTLNVTKVIGKTDQISLWWNHIISPSTFFDIKVSQLITYNEDNVDLLLEDQFAETYSEHLNWRHYAAPTGYEVGRLEESIGTRKSNTLSFDGNITSQLNYNNLLKLGAQFFYYDINVNERLSASNISSVRLNKYRAFPYEGAIYVQDKMEFEGLIANIGLRYDFYNFNTEYFTDKFSPYRNPAYDPQAPNKGGYYDKELAGKEKTKLEQVLQPRIGISFPVSDRTVLHLNYGVFTQRPAFERIFNQRLKLETNPDYDELGNPQLKPEQTIAYDLGLVRSLPLGLYIDVSAYLKDVSNLLQYAIYEDKDGNRYFTFDNREYADIEGFHISLEKNAGIFRGYIRYNWELGTGKSASAVGSGARAEYFESDRLQDVLPSPEDILLDSNREHKLVCNLRLNTGKRTGFKVFNIYPIANISISGTYKLATGRPFTYDVSGSGLQMNRRTPTEYDLSMRFEKGIDIVETQLTIYLEGFNLLNNKVFDYDRTFRDERNAENQFKRRYVEDRNNLLTWPNFAPYVSSLDGYLLSNQPMHFTFGIKVDF